MKKFILSLALLSTPLITTANNFVMPGFNNGNGFNNGSSWNMPTMNWGNGYNNSYNNGSNWNMPSMNWGSGNNGSNWNMPTMNWGNSGYNNNGYNNASNWSMPTMNWGNGYNNGSNWNMPNMNWGNGNQPWNFGNSYNNGFSNNAPNVQYRAPAMPTPPQFIPRLNAQSAQTKVPAVQKPIAVKTTVKKTASTAPATAAKVTVTTPKDQLVIPTPAQVKGTILAPENKPSIEIQKK